MPSPNVSLLVVATLAAQIAGCVGNDPAISEPSHDRARSVDGNLSRDEASQETGVSTSTLVSQNVPTKCDPSRPAVVHLSEKRPAAWSGSPPIPCASGTGYNSGEPTLGVSPKTGAVYFFPAWTSDLTVQPDGIGVMRSKDEGATWERLDPGVANRNLHVVDLDPYFYLDPATGRIFADNLATVNCSLFSFSDDEGESWLHSISGCTEFDHQTIFAGPPAASPTVGYPNIIYRCAINAVAFAGLSTASTCMKSLDGGLTFVPTGEPAFVTPRENLPSYCDGATGHGWVDPSTGRVYLPKGLCGQPWLAMSDDEGATWTRVQVSDLGMSRGADGYPNHEAGVGTDPEGNVYYFWIAEDRLPRLSISRDDGLTWSDPMEAGIPGLVEASLPELIVGGVGKLAFVYMGSTNSPGSPFPTAECQDPVCIGPAEAPGYEETTWNGYIGMTVNALDPEPVFFSASVNPPSDPLIRGYCSAGRCQEAIDFLDIRIGPDGTPWASFVDGCQGECASGARATDNAAEGTVGRLWGGPSLWDHAP